MLAARAFKRWKDHRPSFDDMHSEDQQARPSVTAYQTTSDAPDIQAIQAI